MRIYSRFEWHFVCEERYVVDQTGEEQRYWFIFLMSGTNHIAFFNYAYANQSYAEAVRRKLEDNWTLQYVSNNFWPYHPGSAVTYTISEKRSGQMGRYIIPYFQEYYETYVLANRTKQNA